MLAGLISNIVLIPLLERFPGRDLVRYQRGDRDAVCRLAVGAMVVGEDRADHPDQAGHAGLV